MDVALILKQHELEIGARIGAGRYAKVYVARAGGRNSPCRRPSRAGDRRGEDDEEQEGDELLVAVKVLPKANLMEALQARVERDVLHTCDHPYIARLVRTFQDNLHLCIVMQFASGGDLSELLREEGSFSEEATRTYVAEVVCALGHLHGLLVVYRGLAPQNLMLQSNGNLLLGDFGSSKYMRKATKTYTQCGVSEYMAPELCQGNGHDYAVDFWALGVLTFHMMTGETPFGGAGGQYELEGRIRRVSYVGDYSRLYLEGEVGDFVDALIQRNPLVRLGCCGHKYYVLCILSPDVLTSKTITFRKN
eukprot:TRINITY_DN12747_c0_g1_i4.p1 TRINITY_DN12747_c0_g1~~TRINITY_DN12747_c0_g1_i4.p1  ORF type:complete len:330 (-),score=42.22 TRINITY_DN12747_c0_g1_i4:51-968(-)